MSIRPKEELMSHCDLLTQFLRITMPILHYFTEMIIISVYNKVYNLYPKHQLHCDIIMFFKNTFLALLNTLTLEQKGKL